MDHLIIPKDYKPDLNLHDTQVAIKTVKDCFQELLAERLNLTRVSAPLFVDPDSGLNDNLNGVERPVAFDIKEQDGKIMANRNIFRAIHERKWLSIEYKNGKEEITKYWIGIIDINPVKKR